MVASTAWARSNCASARPSEPTHRKACFDARRPGAWGGEHYAAPGASTIASNTAISIDSIALPCQHARLPLLRKVHLQGERAAARRRPASHTRPSSIGSRLRLDRQRPHIALIAGRQHLQSAGLAVGQPPGFQIVAQVRSWPGVHKRQHERERDWLPTPILGPGSPLAEPALAAPESPSGPCARTGGSPARRNPWAASFRSRPATSTVKSTSSARQCHRANRPTPAARCSASAPTSHCRAAPQARPRR